MAIWLTDISDEAILNLTETQDKALRIFEDMMREKL